MSNSSNLIFEVIQLRAEVKLLRAEVRDVRNALVIESDSTTESIKHIGHRLSGIDDRLLPVFQKVFPEAEVDQRQIDACLKPKPTG